MHETRIILEWEDLELYKLLHPFNGIFSDVQGMIADPPMLIRRYRDHLN